MEQAQMRTIPGPKILLEGPSGTGKTHSIGTLVDWAQQNGERQVYCVFSENGMETLMGYWRDRDLEIPANLHWTNVQAESVGFGALLKNASNIGKMDYKLLSQMNDPTRNVNSAMEQFLQLFIKFRDQNGKEIGALDETPADSIIVVDSLSAINYFITRLIVGARPVMAQGEYMVAQKFIYDFLFRCTQSLEQTFVLTAHVDRLMDETLGGVKLMTKTPGSKLASEIPPLFSEVILTTREGDKYYWDTANSQADLKSRYLPLSSKHSPNFAPIMTKWLTRQGQ